MQLNELSPAKKSQHSRKRVGRGDGSGLGKTSGRGEKGQKARSGGGVRLGFEGGQMPLTRRVPKRGFTNIFAKKFALVNLEQLSCFQEGSEVTAKEFKQKGFVSSVNTPVKILARGDLSINIQVKANACSHAAQKKIEEAGGTLEIIQCFE